MMGWSVRRLKFVSKNKEMPGIRPRSKGCINIEEPP
jgi:hypothetical protein